MAGRRVAGELKTCSRCGERRSVDDFYFVSKKTGARRGQCKDCMREIKAAQRDPNWKPSCARCGEERERVGPGRRLCASCFHETYDAEAQRDNGSSRLKLKPCPICGVERLRQDHEPGTMLCPTCRSASPQRRRRLSLYNLTPAEESALLDYQGRSCAICGRRPSSRKSLSIDHQHREPSIVRGMLCSRCNTVLGLMKDNAEALARAAAYLTDPPAQQIMPGKVATEEANRSSDFKKNPWRRAA